MVEIVQHVATIILAAGYSSRMQGAFKPLLKLGDCTVLEHAIQAHLAAGIHDVRVVVGYRADDVIGAVSHLGVRVVTNPDFDKGMFSSIQAGVATLEPAVKAFFIMPTDIPGVHPATIRSLLDTYDSGSCGILYPVYHGKKGHPPLISSRYIHEILESPGPDGLRGILKSHEEDACTVVVDDAAVLLDIDTPMDYQRLLDQRGGTRSPISRSAWRFLNRRMPTNRCGSIAVWLLRLPAIWSIYWGMPA